MPAILTRRVAVRALLPVIAATLGFHAAAEPQFPARPLRMIVANTPGSTVDLVGRHLGERLAATLGQPVTIMNQPGAGGIIGSQAIAQAPKDGYTLGFYGNTAVIVPHLQKSLSYDPVKDITTVAIVGNIPFVAVVPRDSPYRTLEQLIEAGRRGPGQLKLGSAGSGTAIHLAGMQFQAAAGIEMLHVPYKGVAPIQTALLAGEVDVAFPTVGSVAAFVKDGRLRALATTGRQRSPVMAQVPTVAQAGLRDFAFESWLALVAPSGVPAPVLRRLGEDVRLAVATEPMQKMFADNSITPDLVVGEAAQKIVLHDYQAMGELVRKSGAVGN